MLEALAAVGRGSLGPGNRVPSRGGGRARGSASRFGVRASERGRLVCHTSSLSNEHAHADGRIDRFRACLLGAMIGDSLGMRFDGIDAGPLRHRYPDLAAIISHRLPLAEGVRGYELFAQRLDGCTKVVLEP